MINEDVMLDLDERIRIRDELITKIIKDMPDGDREDILWEVMISEYEYESDYNLIDDYKLIVDDRYGEDE